MTSRRDLSRKERESTDDQLQGGHFAKDIILVGVRWYVAYPLSYRHVEELMEERGVSVDHATIQRWVVKYSPQLESDAEMSLSHAVSGGVIRASSYSMVRTGKPCGRTSVAR
jgi:transposase-like protein